MTQIQLEGTRMTNMEMEAITYSVADGVATLTLNRPAKKNALDSVMRTEIGAVIAELRRDRGIQALVITGAGGAFCAGGDLRAMDTGGNAEVARNRMADLHVWMHDLLTLDRAVIAAVDGPAYGAGFGLALAADFIIASPRARFCLSFQRPRPDSRLRRVLHIAAHRRPAASQGTVFFRTRNQRRRSPAIGHRAGNSAGRKTSRARPSNGAEFFACIGDGNELEQERVECVAEQQSHDDA